MHHKTKGIFVSKNHKAIFTSALQGYASLATHQSNFALIGKISHKIGILEIIMRNTIDDIIKTAKSAMALIIAKQFGAKNLKEQNVETIAYKNLFDLA